jgi:TatD DNase family protein
MRMVNIHTHQSSDRADVVELVNQYPLSVDASAPHFSIGIHPWYINADTIEEEIDIIKQKLLLPNCTAIGECGLDKRIDVPIKLQQQVFERQLSLAAEHRKPVIIHCVAAFQELIAIKNTLSVSTPMVVHGFSKSAELAKQLLDNGFYLSFGKYLLRNPELKKTFLSVPDDRYLLETDSIDEGIAAVYQRAAEYRNQTVEHICKQTANNFRKFINVSF